MKKLGMKFLVILAVLYIAQELFGVVEVVSPAGAILFGIVLLLVNMTIKPILLLISLPITIITIGIFSLFINTWMVMLADKFVTGVHIEGFWSSLMIAVSFSLLNGILLYNKK